MEAEEERLSTGEGEYAHSDPETVGQLTELETLPAPGSEMAQFLGELERRWPSLETDPDGSSHGASSPLWQPMLGGGTGLNIVWSQAEAMRAALVDLAGQCNVIVYDPQSEEVILPVTFTTKRSWFKRRG
jgi:hypothetical protein